MVVSVCTVCVRVHKSVRVYVGLCTRGRGYPGVREVSLSAVWVCGRARVTETGRDVFSSTSTWSRSVWTTTRVSWSATSLHSRVYSYKPHTPTSYPSSTTGCRRISTGCSPPLTRPVHLPCPPLTLPLSLSVSLFVSLSLFLSTCLSVYVSLSCL